ncbi:uncharacterized protein LOC129060828 [Pongo abelii]|uniref:uncharacterized protein LOC129060828 n=1 Tax=Pongo abelii TaxID=9601 RepID=UPI0030059DEC
MKTTQINHKGKWFLWWKKRKMQGNRCLRQVPLIPIDLDYLVLSFDSHFLFDIFYHSPSPSILPQISLISKMTTAAKQSENDKTCESHHLKRQTGPAGSRVQHPCCPAKLRPFEGGIPSGQLRRATARCPLPGAGGARRPPRLTRVGSGRPDVAARQGRREPVRGVERRLWGPGAERLVRSPLAAPPAPALQPTRRCQPLRPPALPPLIRARKAASPAWPAGDPGSGGPPVGSITASWLPGGRAAFLEPHPLLAPAGNASPSAPGARPLAAGARTPSGALSAGGRSLIRDDWHPSAGLFRGFARPRHRAVHGKCGSGSREAASTVAWCSSGRQRASAYLGHRSLSFLSAPNGYGK